jgi:DNA-binding transcriptional regulator YhcF (GntR family)
MSRKAARLAKLRAIYLAIAKAAAAGQPAPSIRHLAELVGVGSGRVVVLIDELRARGLLECEGTTRARTYLVVKTGQRTRAWGGRPDAEAKAAARRAKVLQAIREAAERGMPPPSVQGCANLLGCSKAVAFKVLSELETAGLLRVLAEERGASGCYLLPDGRRTKRTARAPAPGPKPETRVSARPVAAE